MASFGQLVGGALASGARAIGVPFNLGVSSAIGQGAPGVAPGVLQGAPANNGVPGNPTNFGPTPTPQGSPIGAGSAMGAANGAGAAANGQYAAGSAGSSTYNADTDPTLIAQALAQVSPLMAQISQLYSGANSQLGSFAQDQNQQLENQTNQALANNSQAYQTNQDQTDANFTGRNAYDSSYRGNADQSNTDAYNQSNQALQQQEQAGQQTIGNTINQEKAALAQNGPQNYDLSQYSDVNSLLGLRDQLNQHIANLQGVQNATQTGGQLQQSLANEVQAPTSTLSTDLNSKLQALTQGGASPDAQYALGQGYINLSGLPQDQKNQANQYFLSLLNPSAPKPTTAAPAAVA